MLLTLTNKTIIGTMLLTLTNKTIIGTMLLTLTNKTIIGTMLLTLTNKTIIGTMLLTLTNKTTIGTMLLTLTNKTIIGTMLLTLTNKTDLSTESAAFLWFHKFLVNGIGSTNYSGDSILILRGWAGKYGNGTNRYGVMCHMGSVCTWWRHIKAVRAQAETWDIPVDQCHASNSGQQVRGLQNC